MFDPRTSIRTRNQCTISPRSTQTIMARTIISTLSTSNHRANRPRPTPDFTLSINRLPDRLLLSILDKIWLHSLQFSHALFLENLPVETISSQWTINIHIMNHIWNATNDKCQWNWVREYYRNVLRASIFDSVLCSVRSDDVDDFWFLIRFLIDDFSIFTIGKDSFPYSSFYKIFLRLQFLRIYSFSIVFRFFQHSTRLLKQLFPG